MMSDDPLHCPGSLTTHWTTDNVGEAMPGVASPLGWSIWESDSDPANRELFHRIGILTRSERDSARPISEPVIRIFYGRIAMCMEWLGVVGDRMPGTTGPDAITGMLGRVPDTMTFTPSRRRYPVIAAKLPIAATRAIHTVRSLSEPTRTWWKRSVAAVANADEHVARATLRDGADRYRHLITEHGVVLFAASTPVTHALNALITRAGVGDLGTLSGTGGAEMRIVEDLWRASRDEISIARVVAEHGYHGPLEGELASRVWREDPEPLRRIVTAYAKRPDDDDPIAHNARAIARLPQLQRDVISAVPRSYRPAARAILALATRTLPMRGVGKAAFVQALDVSRAAARRLGNLYADNGRLDDPDDVFFLTLHELRDGLPSNARDLVAARRVSHEYCRRIQLPHSWRGTPALVDEVVSRAAVGDVITGVGVSTGQVEGRVRIVTDPSFAEVEPDEILISHTTDPSWASIMFVSAAIVVDIGGMVSHAAVVARELGIPAVVNTRCGTELLRDGDWVRVDGAAGTVELIDRTSLPATTSPRP
jgi:phosphohistidine swiveling domain-containing protein